MLFATFIYYGVHAVYGFQVISASGETTLLLIHYRIYFIVLLSTNVYDIKIKVPIIFHKTEVNRSQKRH